MIGRAIRFHAALIATPRWVALTLLAPWRRRWRKHCTLPERPQILTVITGPSTALLPADIKQRKRFFRLWESSLNVQPKRQRPWLGDAAPCTRFGCSPRRR